MVVSGALAVCMVVSGALAVCMVVSGALAVCMVVSGALAVCMVVSGALAVRYWLLFFLTCLYFYCTNLCIVPNMLSHDVLLSAMFWCCVIMAEGIMSVILVMSKLTGVNYDPKVGRYTTVMTVSYDRG